VRRTADEIIKQSRSAFFCDSVADELRNPGDDLKEYGGVDRFRSLGEGCCRHDGQDHLWGIEQLWGVGVVRRGGWDGRTAATGSSI